MAELPVFDIWICQGRMCQSAGNDALASRAHQKIASRSAPVRARILRGGCYGFCELAGNVVVRRYRSARQRPPEDEDRLSLTGRDNEWVYATVAPEDLDALLDAHLGEDRPIPRLLADARERAVAPDNETAARLRALRQSKRKRRPE